MEIESKLFFLVDSSTHAQLALRDVARPRRLSSVDVDFLLHPSSRSNVVGGINVYCFSKDVQRFQTGSWAARRSHALIGSLSSTTDGALDIY